MFQHLFKRFKRNHSGTNTPPTSPSSAMAADPDIKSKQDALSPSTDDAGESQQPTTSKKPEPEPQPSKKNTDSDDDSVGSYSSSYSDHDYLTPDSGHNSSVQEENHPTEGLPPPKVDNNNNKDAQGTRGSVSSRSSDESSSYSDYDDYQFLTAVSAAAAARRASGQQQQPQQQTQETEIDPNTKTNDHVSGPPATITIAKTNDENDPEPQTVDTQQPFESSTVTVVEEKNKTVNDHSTITPVELEALARTAFPDFFTDSEHGVPGAILSDGTDSSSSDEDEDSAAVQRKTERYRTKEDEDVAVFMNLAKRMSLKSLLHLLKGHVQSQRDQYSVEYMKQYNNALKHYKSASSSSSDLSSAASLNSILSKQELNDEEVNKNEAGATLDAQANEDSSPPRRHHHHRRRHKKHPPLQKKKLFRWAEVTGDQVRTVVHEIESFKYCMELWWQPGEMHAIRLDLVDTVKFYRKRRPGYIQSVEIVARFAGELFNTNAKASSSSTADEAVSSSYTSETSAVEQISQCISHQQQLLEEHMKSLMSAEHSYARGLETHIVKMLSDHRKSTVSAVIDEQRECKLCNDDYETTSHCLREQSIAYSNMSTKFAYAMARCDQIEGLKSSMSAWKQE
ncbi:hypothetical protein IV203_011684 [Nitzschia inconspicua]|uniref:Uncharacterized protein n=1 Tax=Nitzschia inconspicua TaxID=303405 RepID=A0A9K3KT72_9STRA|nr:hypothetical protein IV203_011684 [Nitzschia inconspicua]